ncbi:MAG: RluA family pseudouridine synthase [Thermodesulfobacteriota bacterium]
MSGPKTLVVTQAEAGQKLIQYLGRALGPDMPGSVFMRWIRTGQVRLDGKRAKPFDRVEAGQAVRLPPFAELAPGRGQADAPSRPAAGETPESLHDAKTAPGPAAASLPATVALASIRDAATGESLVHPPGLGVIAGTDRWLVIAKPAGLPVHPGSGWTDSVQTRIGQAFRGEAFVPTLVHRLDRDTSGVLLAARTHRALTAAHEAIRSGEAVKEYLCWVRGEWKLSAPGEAVEMTDRLEKSGPEGRERMKAGGEGRLARLSATPLLIENGHALIAVRLFTGRTHQIRAQLSSRGHPIVGDAKYGGGRPPMLLHAWMLTILGDSFQCPPPWTGRWAVPPGMLESSL